MIRPFQLRDLALLHRLGDRGVLLNSEAALTTSQHPLRSALKNLFVGGRYSTFVWKAPHAREHAFVQLFWDPGQVNARLTYLAADGESTADGASGVSEDVWLPLLDELAVEVGRRGGHNLVAEVSENGPELPVLRRASFTVYTRRDIWLHRGEPMEAPSLNLRPCQPADDWDAHVLYANMVPRLIQTVEPNPPLESGDNWVLYEEHELAAFVHIVAAPDVSWMRILIHPNANTSPKEIIRGALWAAGSGTDHPVFCCVGRHQSWLQGPLADVGFELWGSQAVMVRHIAKRVEYPSLSGKAVLEAQGVASSSPLVQSFSHRNGNGHLESHKTRNPV